MNIKPDSELTLVKKVDDRVDADFFIATHPVTAKAYYRVIASARQVSGSDDALMKTSWSDAVVFCNRLSLQNGLPAAYAEASGRLLNSEGDPAEEIASVMGFRLPTFKEWEYAAKSWSGPRRGSCLEVMRKHFKIPYLDYPTTEEMVELYANGYSRTGELTSNDLGIYGMLVYAKEWCGDCRRSDGGKNHICHWHEYIVNYDNAVSYDVRSALVEHGGAYCFRVALNSDSLAGLVDTAYV